MTDVLQTTETLPATSCTREDIYSLIESVIPLVAITDDESLTVLNNQIRAATRVPRWQKVGAAVDYEDLAASALTNDIELFTLPGAGVIHAVKIKHSTAFSGGALSSYKLSVGIAGNLVKYAAPFDVFQAVGDTAFGLNHEFGGETHDAGGTSIRLAAESIGANLDAATAGVVDVWVLWSVTSA